MAIDPRKMNGNETSWAKQTQAEGNNFRNRAPMCSCENPRYNRPNSKFNVVNPFWQKTGMVLYWVYHVGVQAISGNNYGSSHHKLGN